jgi:hypothetical protein
MGVGGCRRPPARPRTTPSDLDWQAAADPPGLAAVADRQPDRPGRRRAARTRGVGDRDGGGSVDAGADRADGRTGPGAPGPADGWGLLAVDHSVLRKGAYPPRVLVNGQPASATLRLGRGDRVAVSPGPNRMELVARAAQQLPAGQPDDPIRSLPTGPAQAVLDRGQLSGRVVPVAFHPAGGKPGPLPVALTFDDGPWPHTTAQILTILGKRQAPATFFVVGRQVQRYPELSAGSWLPGWRSAAIPGATPSPSTGSWRPCRPSSMGCVAWPHPHRRGQLIPEPGRLRPSCDRPACPVSTNARDRADRGEP